MDRDGLCGGDSGGWADCDEVVAGGMKREGFGDVVERDCKGDSLGEKTGVGASPRWRRQPGGGPVCCGEAEACVEYGLDGCF